MARTNYEHREERTFPRRKTLTEEKPREDAPQATESEEIEVVGEVAVPVKKADTGYFDAFGGVSLVEALESIGEDSSFASRAKLGKANGIPNYYGRPDQNTKLLNLARSGKLKRA